MIDQSDLYTSIIRLNAEAADARQFEVAYHLLAAALHAAEPLIDTDAIEAVIRIATEQGAAVDAMEDHPMASVSAARRGNTPLYETLIIMARAKLSQFKAQHLVEKDGPSVHDDKAR